MIPNRVGTSLAFILLWLSTHTIKAQMGKAMRVDTLSHTKFMTMVNYNKDQSYVTFGSGIGNQIPLIFEAEFSPSYFISSNKTRWAMMMNPQVQLRMLDKTSVPIQVPSYRMYGSYFRTIDNWNNSIFRRLLYDHAMWFASYVHHSNGQDGRFYLNDTTKVINLANGNFSINYLELGLSSYKLTPSLSSYFSLRQFKIHADLYPAAGSDPRLKNIYGFIRIFNTFDFGGPWKQGKADFISRWLQNSTVQIKVGWILDNYRGFQALDATTRLIVDLNYKYYLPWFDEVAFFLRFYHGQDYYNIYFERQLTTLSFGITTNTIKLASNIHYIERKSGK
jgi:hypothetical protein